MSNIYAQFLNKPCIIRCESTALLIAVPVEIEGKICVMEKARIIHTWSEGALSSFEISTHGLKPTSCNITEFGAGGECVLVTDMLCIMPLTDKAEKALSACVTVNRVQ